MNPPTSRDQPEPARPGRSGRTPPGSHWVKALVPAALHFRLRAYAGLSEMTLPDFVLATLSNAVPLAAPASPQGTSSNPEGRSSSHLDQGPLGGPDGPTEPRPNQPPTSSSGTPSAPEGRTPASDPLSPPGHTSPALAPATDPLSPEGAPHA